MKVVKPFKYSQYLFDNFCQYVEIFLILHLIQGIFDYLVKMVEFIDDITLERVHQK